MAIAAGDDVYVDDGDYIIGHVRRANAREFVVYVEERGDFTLPHDTVKRALNNAVLLICKKLPLAMRAQIGHLHGERYEEEDA